MRFISALSVHPSRLPSVIPFSAVFSADEEKIQQTLEHLVGQAIATQAPSIHIEPRPNNVLVRLRVDNVLKTKSKLGKPAADALIAHIQLLAGMAQNQPDKPASGKFQLKLAKKMYDIEVVVLPVVEGQRVTLHIK